MNKTCAFLECNRPIIAGGLCRTHYQQKWLGKELTAIRSINHRKQPEIQIYPSPYELGWLTGLLEGEGYLSSSSQGGSHVISLRMTDKDVVTRFEELVYKLTTKHYKIGIDEPDLTDLDKQNHRTVYYTFVTGSAARAIMRAIYPGLGERRKEQVRNALRGLPLEPLGGANDTPHR